MAESNLYDHPHLYDLAFRDENQEEADFLEQVWQRHGTGRLKKLLEPGCGSGRMVVEMAKRGYQVTGFDLNEPSLKYLRTRLKRSRKSAQALQLDMVDFSIPKQFDLAFCTMNTFRHLTTEDAARRHLQSVADHLRPGGLYVLGFHLLPPDVDEQCIERWHGKDRNSSVTFTLRVLDFCRRKRLETIRISMLARTKKGEIRGRTEFQFRIYKAQQFQRLLEKVPDFELEEIYDFDYDIDFPRDLDNQLDDAVFILKKN